MKRCQNCNFQNEALIDYCWQCGSPLPNFSGAGNYYQHAAQTQAFNNGAQNNYGNQGFNASPNNYAPQFQTSASSPNYGKLAAVLGSIFVFLLLVSGVGAALMYKVMVRPPVKPYQREQSYRNEPVKTNPVKAVEPVEVPPSKHNSKPVKTNTASTKFDKIWVDYNVKENGRLGMRIHVKFSVFNLKNVDSYLAVYFEKTDGTKLKTTNKKFASNDGQVAVYRSLKPGYDETVYSDLDVFMPYDEFKLSRGKYNLKLDADVIYENGDLVEHLNYYEFQYEKFRK